MFVHGDDGAKGEGVDRVHQDRVGRPVALHNLVLILCTAFQTKRDVMRCHIYNRLLLSLTRPVNLPVLPHLMVAHRLVFWTLSKVKSIIAVPGTNPQNDHYPIHYRVN